jgi:uncharacterized membrane protein
MKRRKLEPWDYRSSQQYNSSLDAVGVALLGFIIIILSLMMVSKCKSPDQPKVKKEVIAEYKEKYAVNITDGKRKYLDHIFKQQEQ